MEIAFFTEMAFQGKIPRTHTNMRTEFAWMCALEADHHHYMDIPQQHYDLGIVIIPKKQASNHFSLDRLRQCCDKIAVMQEGPNWYFQDYDLEKQIWYYNTLTSADIIFVHNELDKKYYQGLTNHPDVRIMPSLMIEESIGQLSNVDRKDVIIGGNFVSWYGGFDSFIIAQEISENVYAPSMGRKQPNEEQLLTHLPYMDWKTWIHSLNKFKYGIHLMRTHAAGTFALNCAYLGIPCIGYKGLDTQEILHPELTVDIGDLISARNIAKNLRNDEDFYLYYSNKCKELYQTYYTEQHFLDKFKGNK